MLLLLLFFLFSLFFLSGFFFYQSSAFKFSVMSPHSSHPGSKRPGTQYTFDRLPPDIHLVMSDYFFVPDLISLSQTSQQCRQLYGPISWRNCSISDNHAPIWYNDQWINSRIIDSRMFFKPEKYSWFFNYGVRRFVARYYHETFTDTKVNYFEDIEGLAKLFPKLQKIKILHPMGYHIFGTKARSNKLEHKHETILKLLTSPAYSQLMDVGIKLINQRASRPENISSLFTIDKIQRFNYNERLKELVLYISDNTIEPFSFNLPDVTFPKLESVSLHIYNSDLARQMLHFLRNLSNCKSLEVAVAFYDNKYGIRWPSLLMHLDDMRFSKPVISLTTCWIENSRHPVSEVKGYYSPAEFLGLLGNKKISLPNVSTLKGYSRQVQSLLDILHLPNVTELVQFSHTFEMFPCTDHFETVRSITMHVRALEIAYFPKIFGSLAKFRNLENLNIMNKFDSTNFQFFCYMASKNFASYFLETEFNTTTIVASRTDDLCRKDQLDSIYERFKNYYTWDLDNMILGEFLNEYLKTVCEDGEEDFLVFQEIACGVLAEEHLEEKYEIAPNNNLYYEAVFYMFSFLVYKIFKIASLKQLVLCEYFPYNLHTLFCLVKLHPSIETVEFSIPDSKYHNPDITSQAIEMHRVTEKGNMIDFTTTRCPGRSIYRFYPSFARYRDSLI